MSLLALSIDDLRCIEHAELALHPGQNLVWGGNGSGKTSLLEGIFLLGRGRSFRTRNSERLVRHGRERLVVFGRSAAIIDGPGYSFSIRAPEGWRMTSTRQLQAAFYPADKTFETTSVIMYVRSADKARLHFKTIEEMNRFDLHGIQGQHPKAESKKIGSARTSDAKEIPVYSFSAGGYFERVAYAEQPKTITVFVASAEKEDDLKSSEKAFRELVASYLFISDNVTTPNHP